MKKAILTMIALAFTAGVGSAYAAGDDATKKACKDKKPGEMVKVDGKDVKCPEKK